MALIDGTGRPNRGSLLIPAAIAIGAAVLVTVWSGLGVLSLPGLALLAIVGPLAFLLCLYVFPQVLVILPPALMPLPLSWAFFPHEIAFGMLATVVLFKGLQDRAPWFRRLETFEVANLAFLGWAFFSGFWCGDSILYILGVRRLLVGWASFWVAYRLALLVPRRWFELSLMAGATSLVWTALDRRMTSGFTDSQLKIRAAGTDFGWGTANYIATILLVMSPMILNVAFRSRERWLKAIAWPCLALIALLQTMIASRAATILFFAGALVQVGAGQVRRRWLGILGVAAALTGLLLTPFGQTFLDRFSSAKEFGSIVIRMWYFRDAWRRVVDNLPWGMGLNQGLIYPDHLAYNDPHNYWLAVGSELGVVGVIGWMVVLLMLWRRIGVMASTPGWKHEGRALQIAFCLSQLHTLVEPTFQGPHYQFIHFWVMGGYLGYHARNRAVPAPP